MSSENTDSNKPVGVTKEIIEAFLAELTDLDVESEIIANLRKTILEDGKSTKAALEKSLFASE